MRRAKIIKPEKLKPGDTVRVIAPSRGLALLSADTRKQAVSRLTALGLKVEFGRYAEVSGPQGVAPVEQRLEDLHDAFSDPGVRGVLTVLGGFHANQLLDDIDYRLLKANPKVFCGFSDISVLNNAIFQHTGLVTYSGPHFSSFGMRHGFEYSLSHFARAVMSDDAIELQPARHWSDDEWFIDQEKRMFSKNEGWLVINPGKASGRLLGGNLSTLSLLRGTQHMPELSGSILFLEEDGLTGAATLAEFGRQLQALTQIPGFDGVKALVLGRFQKASQATEPGLREMLNGCRATRSLPVLANVEFGHTTPITTLPVGNRVELDINDVYQKLSIEA